MEAGTTAVHAVGAQTAFGGMQGSEEERSDGRRTRPSLPVTRDFTRTLYAVSGCTVAAAVAGIAAGGGAGTIIAFGVAACGGATAVALRRAIMLLTPPVLRRRRPVRVAVVGAGRVAAELRGELARAAVDRVELVGAIVPERAGSASHPDELGALRDVRELVERHGIELLLIGRCVPHAEVAEAVVRRCEGQDVWLCDATAFVEDVFGCVPILEADSGWMRCLLHPRHRRGRSKRVLDLIVAATVAVLCLPLLGALALLVSRDGGPAVFRQRRVGRDGQPFVLYKLRTMRWQPTDGPACWTEDGDARITRLGRVLRRTHLDELPQLLNVLRGEMTLVGPRPEQPEIAARLDAALPLWRGRHRHPPGLTGWAQVRCGYGGSDDGSAVKLAHDLYYLRRPSLAIDVAILAQTAFAITTAGQFATGSSAPYVVRRTPGTRGRPREDAGAVPVGILPLRAIVTGGAGFIGARLVDELVRAGHDVVAVDDLSSGRAERLEPALAAGARLEIADVTDAALMAQLFADFRPQVVFHLADQAQRTRTAVDPLAAATANVLGTIAVLEAARRSAARRFVFASSGAVYGDAAQIPTREDAPPRPLSPRGAAKRAGEQYTDLYRRLHGMSTIVLRLADVYGPGQGPDNAIATWCRARAGDGAAVVSGADGHTRDYVHVRDVVAALVAAGHSPATGVLNIGTGTETAGTDLARAVGSRLELRPPRPGEVRRSCLDTSSARRVLGWAPDTTLAAGLAELCAEADAMRGKPRSTALQIARAPSIDEPCASSPSPPARLRCSRWPLPPAQARAAESPSTAI